MKLVGSGEQAARHYFYDASGSITEDEIAFQRQSYADALTDPRVIRAIDIELDPASLGLRVVTQGQDAHRLVGGDGSEGVFANGFGHGFASGVELTPSLPCACPRVKAVLCSW